VQERAFRGEQNSLRRASHPVATTRAERPRQSNSGDACFNKQLALITRRLLAISAAQTTTKQNVQWRRDRQTDRQWD